MHVAALQHGINALLVGRQLSEVTLRGGRHRFDDIFERITIGAIEQVEDLHRHFGVGEEERIDIALRQVFGNRGVVGEVAVVHQRFIQTDEWVSTARVPDAALGGITMVPDPDMGVHIFELIIADNLVAITHHLEHQQILAMRKHEGALFAQGCIKGGVEFVAVLINVFIFN